MKKVYKRFGTFEELEQQHLERMQNFWYCLYYKTSSFYIRSLNKIKSIYWEIRSWFFPFNVVKAKTLSRTYVDRDHLLLHIVFQIVVDFCEKELKNRPKQEDYCKDNNNDKEWYNFYLEIWSIYDWWKTEYPQFEKDIEKYQIISSQQRKNFDDRPAPAFYKAKEIEEQMHKETEEKLKRVMELRLFMWT